MGNQYETLTEQDIQFIHEQKMFFIASCSGKEVNLSPKGYDSILVLSNKQLLFLDFPGSGNRTGRDIENEGSVTLMFTAFSGKPKILRLFCKGKLINRDHADFNTFTPLFNDFQPESIRRFILFDILTVENSCGMSVPLYDYKENRNELKDWAEDKGNEKGVDAYIEKRKIPPEIKY